MGGILYEAELSSQVKFTDNGVTTVDEQGTLFLPNGIVTGLLLAVVGSPKNSDEKLDGEYSLTISKDVNIFWGKREAIFRFLRPTLETPDKPDHDNIAERK